MELMRAPRVAYIHPAGERELNESVLIGKGSPCRVVSARNFTALKRWLQDDLGAEYILIPGQGWTLLSDIIWEMALPEDFSVHARESTLGKRTRATPLDKPTLSSKRVKAMEKYKLHYVPPDMMLGPRDEHFLLTDLRWLRLLVNEGRQVALDKLRQLRRDGTKPGEAEYYAGVLAMLKAASFGQQGLDYTGQGFGSVSRSDLQGFINGEKRAACGVKADLKMATDKDPHGIQANALAIKQEVDYLVEGIHNTLDTVRLGCLFSRMERLFILKFERDSHTVAVTPSFPNAFDSSADDDFIVMRLAWLDRSSKDRLVLSDVLPSEPTAGFGSLVAYVEELQRVFALAPSAVRFVSHDGQEIQATEMSRLASGPKSLVLLRRSSRSVVKVCLPEHAANEIQIHKLVDGHENIRKLVSHGRVEIGSAKGAFHFLELEGCGEPLAPEHVATMEEAARMWRQAVSALKHIHSCGVLHRDVKPDNMLVMDGGVLKLNDFDVSCFKGDGRDASEFVGTEGFQSPSDMSPYSEEDDILSLGLAFYKLKAGVSLPGKESRLHILQRELHPDRFPECTRRDVFFALQKLRLEAE